MDELLTERKLQAVADIEARNLADGMRLLKQTRRAEYVALDAMQQRIVACFDGEKSVQEILEGLLAEAERPDIREFYDLTLFALDHGFLVDAGGSPDVSSEPTRELVGRSWPVHWGFAVALVCFLLVLVPGMMALIRCEPVMPVTVAGWVAALAIVGVNLSLAAALAGCVLTGFGRCVYRPRLTWRFGLPRFEIDDRDAFMGGRSCQAAVALQELAVPLLFLAYSYCIDSGSLLFGSALSLLILSSPFGDTPAHKLLHAIFRRSYKLPRHAATFLGKGLLRHLVFPSRSSSEEDYLLLYSAYALGWLGSFLLFVSGLIRRQGIDLLDELILAPDYASRAGALGVLLILTAMFCAPFAYQAWLLARNAYATVAPYWFRAEASVRAQSCAQGRPDNAAISGFLRSCLLFADLPEDGLPEIAAAMTFARLSDRATIIRQGDRGDSLFVIYAGGVSISKEDEAGRETEVARLGPGDAFGEIALLDDVPRTATVRSVGETRLLVLHRASFVELLAESLGAAEITTIQICAFLRRTSMFATWPDRALHELAYELSCVEFANGDQLLREGEENQTFYVLYEGDVEVTCEGRSVAQLSTGDFFGEVSLLKGVPTVASVTARSSGRCLTLGRSRFLKLVSQNVHTGLAIEDTLAERLPEGRDV